MPNIFWYLLGVVTGGVGCLWLSWLSGRAYTGILQLQAETGGVEFIGGKPYRIVPEAKMAEYERKIAADSARSKQKRSDGDDCGH